MGQVELLQGERREKFKSNFGYVVKYKEKKSIFDSWSEEKVACVSTYVLRCWLDSLCKQIFEAKFVSSFNDYLELYPDTEIYEFFGIRLEEFK